MLENNFKILFINIFFYLSIFDQLNDDLISLKRVITPDKKSEHRLNDKVLTKHELDNILNCCGLSSDNPYYAIQ